MQLLKKKGERKNLFCLNTRKHKSTQNIYEVQPSISQCTSTFKEIKDEKEARVSNQSQRNSRDHIKVCVISGIHLLNKTNAHRVSQRHIKDGGQEPAPHIKYREAQESFYLGTMKDGDKRPEI